MSEVIRDIIWITPHRPFPGKIVAEVARARGLTVQEILTRTRKRRIAHARQEAMWELRQRTRLSLPQIAERLNLKDHTTVLWGVRAHERRLAEAQEAA